MVSHPTERRHVFTFEEYAGQVLPDLRRDLRVRSLLTNRATYADVTVCGPLEVDPADKTKQTVLNPAVLIEVSSPSTAGDDRGPKLDCYRTIASVQAVVIVAQDRPEVIVHERRPDGS